MKFNKPKTRAGKLWAISLAIVLVVVIGGVAGLRIWYDANLRPVSSSSSTKYFTVITGSTVQQIADDLQAAGLIRNTKAFVAYVNTKEDRDKLQAGTYKLSPSMNVQTIVEKLVTGDVTKNLLTILPGKRLDQIKQAFLTAGYTDAEVESAFNPSNYPSLSSITGLPAGASLEGLLYPDSFQKQSNTPASTIVQESIDEMVSHLSNEVLRGFRAQGLNTYQGVTLASIVAQEADDPASQPMVAQVFLSRLKQGMVLGSDVTAFYASAQAGQSPSVAIDSPYNTRIYKGLPPGPIGNVTDSALSAVANPASSDYLYFLAGDDNKMHFSHTEAEHETAITQYCQIKCSQ